MSALPFRWDIRHREQLGRLALGLVEEPYPGFFTDVRQCCVRILAMCNNADLIFVGRSPECLFDYLSGILANTPWTERLSLLNLSLSVARIKELQTTPQWVAAFQQQLEALHLSPAQLIDRSYPIVFTDVVSTGGTFEKIATLLLSWAEEQHMDIGAVRTKLRFIGIGWQKQTSPHTWRWWQYAKWVKSFSPHAIKNISVSLELYQQLGHALDKVSYAYHPKRWNDEMFQQPPRSEEQLTALRMAHNLYTQGCKNEERTVFASLMSKERAIRFSWYRDLLRQIRASA